MIVSTFNIQNNIRSYNINKSIELFNYIKNNKIDIIGMQEVFRTCDKDLTNIIKDSFSKVGNYRYKLIPFNLNRNEKNPIITKYKILSNKTYYLPYLGSKYKRIVTHAIVLYNDKEISVYNTHLEINNNEIKKSQLNKIYELLKNDDRPLILMGDFNIKSDNELFINFINSLKDLGINRISFNDNTFKESNDLKEIDHIFISKEFKLINKNIIKTLDISDHYPIIIEIELTR